MKKIMIWPFYQTRSSPITVVQNLFHFSTAGVFMPPDPNSKCSGTTVI